tara:strand:- start:295 stop:483 length:189 start_codon:yes stop_codon:yes gene_type:complete
MIKIINLMLVVIYQKHILKNILKIALVKKFSVTTLNVINIIELLVIAILVKIVDGVLINQWF